MIVDQPQSPLSPQTQLDLPFLDTSQTLPREPSPKYLKERDICMDFFSSWTEQDQIEFVEELLLSMHHHQHGSVNAFLKPMLQRDFISLLPKKGLDHVAENILSFLDARSLCAAEQGVAEGDIRGHALEEVDREESKYRQSVERAGRQKRLGAIFIQTQARRISPYPFFLQTPLPLYYQGY